MSLRFAAAAIAAFALAASAQVSSNQSLKGNYYFRQVLLTAGTSANVTSTQTAFGTLTFDGNGNYTMTGQLLAGNSAPAALSGAGTYTVSPGGFTVLSSPLQTGTVNARLGIGALVGSTTETATAFDLFIAIPAAQNTSSQTLSGRYWLSSIELPNGGVANLRGTNFKLTANAAGAFVETSVTGQATNLGNSLTTQTLSGPVTYSISPDGTGVIAFPSGDPTAQLIQGTKNIYVAQDGSYFIGGSTAGGGQGMIVGVQAVSGGATNATWNGLFFTAGLRYDTAPVRLTGVSGAVNVTSLGSVWSRRTHQSDGTFDASPLITYMLGSDGSGTFTSTPGHVNVATGGQVFATSGVDVLSSTSYELYFGVRMPPQSGTGVFIHPQGIYNAASYAPAGYPISPGGFITIFGSGFPTQTASAKIPFPTNLGGVQVSINNVAAPVYTVSSTQISAVVPNSVSGSTAAIQITVNGAKSNVVTVPLAASAPGVFSNSQNGLGDGAILRQDNSVLSQSNPASPGEVIQIFLTGLGTVNPTVPDGTAAPTKPLALVVAPLNVYIGGALASNVQFKGLSPGLASLYQINVQIPPNLGPGPQTLAIQTPEGFTDMVNVWVTAE
jgi:uncharacterized protein (TIGR03437 family)